ncbi:fungal specific transcription factor domain protein [Zymoseptoria brevis]|uniref:Fungal specific transcription factor domain protein n=1 Tax=Zymoseptoria brevis TaxID=1047168 RepID=A0A0F4GUP7_9PEZI|nr:fungal specific transcription factor domain protein [Zymoseptoria brevis]
MSLDAASIANMAAQQMARQLQDSPDQDDSGSNGLKRKADDGQSQSQQRARRNRYVSIACNECKRRKIKCNGQTPCQRCGNLNLECVYAPNCCAGFKDSQEYKEMTSQISILQEQVNSLWDTMNAMRAQMSGGVARGQQMPQQQMTPIDPSLQSGNYSSHSHRGSMSVSGIHASPGAANMSMSPSSTRRKSHSQSNQPTFRGPTSSAFNIGVAKNSLETMGITSQSEEDVSGSGGAGTGTTEASPEPPRSSGQLLPTTHQSKDPLWSIPQEEALRLCRVFEDEMGLMYPVIDINNVLDHATKLYRFMEAAHRTGLMQQGMPGADAIDDEETNILKLVLATALTTEASGRSDLGQRLFEVVQPAVENLMLGNCSVNAIRILVMAAMYEFHRDNEGASWRIIGITARQCLELGLHRRETYDAMQDDAEKSEIILLFWAIYVLDRRWSFGTGMPFAMQDSDISPRLPKPEDRSPYLSAMIQYSALSSKVWRSVASPLSPSRGGAPIDTDNMEYLDYQVVQWHRQIPAHLRYEHPSQLQNGSVATPTGGASSRAAHRLRILLYIRANQMRILIYRPILHSATSIMSHRERAQTVVDVAKDTVRVLTHVNQTTDLYSSQQMTFNAFLTSALAVLFLAVSHTPALFGESVREEFYMALELVRGFSKGSWISKRLWKTIRVLKEVGPRLGLVVKENAPAMGPMRSSRDDLDPSRSAAVAMAGLAGHNVDEMSLFNGVPQQRNQWSSIAAASSSPENMAADLTSLFEAAGGYQALESMNGDHEMHGMDGFSGDEGLTNILNELFERQG